MDEGDLSQVVESLGEPKFRAKQLYRWIYNQRETDFSAMTDLSLGLRQKLAESTVVLPIEIEEKSEGFDGSVKLLIKLNDSELVESVMIPEGERLTVCLSSQVGCNVGCKFCATGYLGFKRNLTAGEIVGQLMLIESETSREVTNIVMMGMGEPLLNRRELFKAVRLIIDPNGLSKSRRRFTISTAGWLPGIEAMIEEKLRVKLAISLNGSTEQQRKQLMPLASKYPLNELVKAGGKYARQAGIRVQIGYLLLRGFNDSEEDAKRLVELLSGTPCKINIMEYNEITVADSSIDIPYKRTTSQQAERFMEILRNANLTVTMRTSRGSDINGACGQLAGKHRVI